MEAAVVVIGGIIVVVVIVVLQARILITHMFMLKIQSIPLFPV